MNKVTATPITTVNGMNATAKVKITGQFGNELAAGLTIEETAVLIYDLIQTLPADNHLRQHLNV